MGNPENRLRLVLVGLGGWGRNWYSSQLANHPDVEVVALVDLDEQARSEGVEKLGLPRSMFYPDLAAAMAQHEFEAVVVAAGVGGHVPVAEAAIAAGKHVLVEKPFAPSVGEAVELTRKAAEADVVVMVSQNYRYFPAAVAASDLVAGGRLGALGAVHVDFRRNLVVPAPETTKHELLSHPLLADMSIHHFDLVRMVIGSDPERITCHPWNPPWSNYRDPPAAMAFLSMKSGVAVTYRGSWVSPAPVTHWAGEWHMEFERGEAVWTGRASFKDLSGESLEITPHGGDPEAIDLPEMELIDRAAAVRSLVKAIRHGMKNGCEGAANIASLAMTYAAIESAETGKTVEIAPS